MTKKLKVSIFTKGSPELGFGHIKRSIDLAHHLEKNGFDASISGLSSFSTSYIPGASKPFKNPHVVIVDSPNPEDMTVINWKKKQIPVLGLDYYGQNHPDLSLCVFDHSDKIMSGARIADFKFAMIREEIRCAAIARKNKDLDLKIVTVSLGGCDTLNLGPKISSRLAIMGFKVNLIAGPFNRILDPTSKQHLKKLGVNRLDCPSNFVQILASSSWAVTSGGGTMFEALHLGLPTWVSPQTERESEIAEHALANRAIIGVGAEPSLPKYEKTSALRSVAQNCIDGRGFERIAWYTERLANRRGLNQLLQDNSELYRHVNIG